MHKLIVENWNNFITIILSIILILIPLLKVLRKITKKKFNLLFFKVLCLEIKENLKFIFTIGWFLLIFGSLCFYIPYLAPNHSFIIFLLQTLFNIFLTILVTIIIINTYSAFKKISGSFDEKKYLSEKLKYELYWFTVELKHQINGLTDEQGRCYFGFQTCDIKKTKFSECFKNLELDTIKNCNEIDKLSESIQYFASVYKYRINQLTQIIIPQLKKLAITSNLKYYLDFLLIQLMEFEQGNSFIENELIDEHTNEIEEQAYLNYLSRTNENRAGCALDDWIKAEGKIQSKNKLNFGYNVFFNEFHRTPILFIAFAEKVWDLLTEELNTYKY